MSGTLLAAISPDMVIGRDGGIPWHYPGDLRRFKRLTLGHTIVMGRRTWESLPPRYRPLPGRTNIVVTSRDAIDGVPVAPSLDYALQMASALEPEAAFILDTLGECLFRKGQLKEAVETQRKALKLAPEQQREEMAERLNKFEKALENRKKAAKKKERTT